MNDLRPVLDPRSIAIIGASSDPRRIGGFPVAALRESGFAGKVYAVNPKYRDIAGTPCFPSVDQLPEPVDLAVLAVPDGEVLPQLRLCHRRGIEAAIVFAAGFAETGTPEGIALQAELVAFAASSGMRIVGPNCMGLVNYRTGAFTTFAGAFAIRREEGSVALLAQSGAFCSALYSIARRAGNSFSHILNTGNEACLGLTDFLAWLIEDPGTDAVLSYVEQLRDGAAFLALARRYRAEGKLLAVFKVGKSEKGAEAARSHTAALAGNQRTYEAAFRAGGVAPAEDLPHLADLGYLHGFRRRRIGSRVAILTVSGAAGAVLADALIARGAVVPTLPDAAQAALRQHIPAYGLVTNPVDFTGNIVNRTDFIPDVLAAVAGAPEIDTLILFAPGRFLANVFASFVTAAAATDKLMVVIDTGESGKRAEMEAAGIAFFDDMSRAVRAVATYAAWSEAALPRRIAPPAGARPEAASILAAARRAGRRSLSEADGKRLLAACGVATVPERLAQSAAEAVAAADSIAYPVVLKAASPDILHKTEIGAVRLGLRDADAVARAHAEIAANVARNAPAARLDGISVQPQIRPVAELLAGLTKDPVFGWLMTVGLGGVWTELMGDVAHRLLPVDAAEAMAMLRSLRGFPLLDGYRGATRADLAAACRAIAALSDAALALGDDLAELEVNPLLIRPAGQGALAADALVILA